MLHFLRVLLLLSFWASGAQSSWAQPTVRQTSLVSGAEPLYLVNSTVIIGWPDFDGLNLYDIQNIKIYKVQNMPPKWQEVGAAGIIDIAFPTRIKSMSLAQLARGLGVEGPVTFTLNGRPLAPNLLRITPGAIGQIRVVREAAAPATVVAIETPLPQKNAHGKYPSGGIFVR